MMNSKNIFSIVIFLHMFSQAFAQDNIDRQTKQVVAEGKLLYRVEMASWHGSDIFVAEFKEKDKIGGYFSYPEDSITKCIFFSNAESPKVIGTISFDSTLNVKSAELNLTEREFSISEYQLHTIRKHALQKINNDTLFKTYNNTSLNLIPLISMGEKKVYVLTGPQQNGVVIFGNDYLITFDNFNNIVNSKQLHKNIIPIVFGGPEEVGKKIEGTMHSHLPETGEIITATDICTLMLFEKFTKWKQHNVVSKSYLSIWDCITDELVVISMKTIDKINKDQKKRNKKD